MTIRSYSELRSLSTFEERFDYLRLRGDVGRDTFGSERYMNQNFYRSHEWSNIRHHVIARDLGRDLGVEGYDIHEKIIVHHMNPMLPEDLIHSEESILDPEFLITTTMITHNAIHYGRSPQSPRIMVERQPGDTKLW